MEFFQPLRLPRFGRQICGSNRITMNGKTIIIKCSDQEARLSLRGPRRGRRFRAAARLGVRSGRSRAKSGDRSCGTVVAMKTRRGSGRASNLVHQVRGWFSGVELKMSRRQGAEEEAYLNRYVTDEQRSRRLIFSSTPWAVQNWRFWRVARSTGMIHIRALRSRLPKSPIPRRRR